MATKEQLTSSLKPAIRADTLRRHLTSFAPCTSHKKDAEGYCFCAVGKCGICIEIQTFVGIFHFTQVCERISEQWKKIGIWTGLLAA